MLSKFPLPLGSFGIVPLTMAESFFELLKRECVRLHQHKTQAGFFHKMEGFYNRHWSYPFTQGMAPAVLVERPKNRSINLLLLVRENEGINLKNTTEWPAGLSCVQTATIVQVNGVQ